MCRNTAPITATGGNTTYYDGPRMTPACTPPPTRFGHCIAWQEYLTTRFFLQCSLQSSSMAVHGLPNTGVHQLRATPRESLARLCRSNAPSARSNQSLPLENDRACCCMDLLGCNLLDVVEWSSLKHPTPSLSTYATRESSRNRGNIASDMTATSAGICVKVCVTVPPSAVTAEGSTAPLKPTNTSTSMSSASKTPTTTEAPRLGTACLEMAVAGCRDRPKKAARG